MTVAYRIRAAASEDLPGLAALWLSLVRFEASLSPRFQVKPEAEKLWLEELDRDRGAGRAEVFVAEDARGRPVGLLHVRGTPGAPFHAEDRIGYVDAVWVEPPHRRQGLAKRLLAEAEAWCRARRLPLLEAGVVVRNREALEAWTHLGFEMTSAVMSRRVPGALVVPAPLDKRTRRLLDVTRAEATHRVAALGDCDALLVSALGARARRVTAVSTEAAAARRARDAGAQALLADPQHLPFVPEAFDRIVARGVLSRAGDAGAAAREMARVLDADGALVADDVLASDDPSRAAVQSEIERARDPAIRRRLGSAQTRAVLESAGLLIEDARGVREPRSLDDWLSSSPGGADAAAKARTLAEDAVGRPGQDPSGMSLRRLGKELRFEHVHGILRAVRR